MKAPDGMASMAAERQHMEEMRNHPDPTHDIVAVDSDGEKLYATESCFSEQEAEDALEDYQSGIYSDNVGDEVAGWEVRER